MAIFCTDETKEMVKKYRGFMNEAMHKQVSVIMGESEIMEEKHVDMFEDVIDEHYKYVSNIHELSYKEKVDHLLWTDVFKCIQVAFDEHQREDCTFDVELSVIEKKVARILTPMIFGDLFYYSRQLKEFNQDKFLNSDQIVKFPKDIVRELEIGIYVTPEMEILRQQELAGIEEAEHTIVCPKCKGMAINQVPNGAGVLEECDFHCVEPSCGWEEDLGEDWDYKSLNLDEEIDSMKKDITSQCPDGTDAGEVASLMIDKMNIKKFTKLISMTIEEMAIFAHTTYNPIDKKFTIDFRVDIDADSAMRGYNIVNLELKEILFHKITYGKNIKESVINSILYTLVLNNSEVESWRKCEY